MENAKLRDDNLNIVKKLKYEASDSYFDLWHIHSDNSGYGNKSLANRRYVIDQLIQLYNEACHHLANKFKSDFQIWILVNEADSNDDALYIHSPNPNAKNFPLELNLYKPEEGNCIFKMVATLEEFTIGRHSVGNENYIILYKKSVGIPLTPADAECAVK